VLRAHDEARGGLIHGIAGNGLDRMRARGEEEHHEVDGADGYRLDDRGLERMRARGEEEQQESSGGHPQARWQRTGKNESEGWRGAAGVLWGASTGEMMQECGEREEE
jgi:hypothetical protein